MFGFLPNVVKKLTAEHVPAKNFWFVFSSGKIPEEYEPRILANALGSSVVVT